MASPRLLGAWTLATAALGGCGPQVMLDFDTDDATATGSGTGDTETAPDVEPPDGTSDDAGPAPTADINAVDILLVIDNSGSMGEEQTRLAQTFGPLAAALEETGADYRIGVTTTDNGNPWCETTTPEGGQLVATSCRSRAQEFVFNGAMTLDVTEPACLDICPAQWSDIEILPTATADDPEFRPRPWLERRGGQTNLPAGLDMATALQCIAPQGIAGCGFESHLESMRKTIVRSDTEGESGRGFLRDGVPLVVLLLTDEEDCSYHKDYETIFETDGNRVFWSDPDAPAPTSAVCWNAGVECTGSPSGYDECHSIDRDVTGNEVLPNAAETSAVIRPVSRYVELLTDLENERKLVNPRGEVYVAVIAGTRSDGAVSYSAAGDPLFVHDFGIDPGCESAIGRAVPPVRLREVAEQFTVAGARNLFSVCDDDYTPAVLEITDALRTLLP